MALLLKIVAALLLLLIATVLLVPLLIDPNDFRDQIRERVAEATGRELLIAGDLELSLFPWLGVTVNEASLAGPPGFAAEPLAQVTRAELRARLMPLFERRLEVERVRLEGLRVNLVRDTSGRANWEAPAVRMPAGDARRPSSLIPAAAVVALPRTDSLIAANAPTVGAPAPRVASGARAQGQSSAGLAVAVERVELVDGQVLWEDRTQGQRLVIEGLTAQAGPIAPGLPLEVQAAGTTVDPATDLRVGFDAEARVTAAGPSGSEAQADRPGPVRSDPSAGAGGLLIELLALRLEATGGSLIRTPVRAEASARALLDRQAGTLSVREILIQSDGVRLTGEVVGQELAGDPIFTGALALAEHDLRAWLEAHELPVSRTADERTLRRVALSLDWHLAGERLDLQDLVLQLDDSRITGSGAVQLTDPPGYRFDLAADRLDLDPYLPEPVEAMADAGPAPAPVPESAQARAPAPTPGPGAEPTAAGVPNAAAGPGMASGAGPSAELGAAERPAPADGQPAQPAVLAGLDLEGRLTVGELRAAGLAFGEAVLDMRAKNGVLDLTDRVQRFYQGRIEGRVGLDLTGHEPVVSLAQRATDIAAGPLLVDAIGEEPLTGRGDATVDLTAAGLSREALIGSLNGQVALSLHDGVVKGFDLEGMVRAAEARLKGRPAADPAQDMAFTNLTATGRITDGVLRSDDLLLTSAYLRVSGRGSVDLGRERFDYLFEPMFVEPPRGRGIKELEDIPIPVRLTGSFQRPEWRVDLAEALRGSAGRRLKEELIKEDGPLKQLEERTGIKGLEQGLRGLFGR